MEFLYRKQNSKWNDSYQNVDLPDDDCSDDEQINEETHPDLDSMKLMIANLFSLCIASIYVNIATNLALFNERMFRVAERVYLETIIIQLLEQNAARQAEHQADDQFHHFHDEVQLEDLHQNHRNVVDFDREEMDNDEDSGFDSDESLAENFN